MKARNFVTVRLSFPSLMPYLWNRESTYGEVLPGMRHIAHRRRHSKAVFSNVVLLTNPSPQAPSPSPVTYTPKHLAERILAEQAAMEARGAIDGERKTITALFADIKNSMDLLEDLDPEEARAIIDPATAPHDGSRASL